MGLQGREKMENMNLEQAVRAERNKLWNFSEQTLLNICQKFDTQDTDMEYFNMLVSVLGFITKKFQPDFRKKLLTDVFLRMEEMFILNVDLNFLLMKSGIIDVAEWDKYLAIFMHDSSGSIQQKEVHFLATFINQSVVK